MRNASRGTTFTSDGMRNASRGTTFTSDGMRNASRGTTFTSDGITKHRGEQHLRQTGCATHRGEQHLRQTGCATHRGEQHLRQTGCATHRGEQHLRQTGCATHRGEQHLRQTGCATHRGEQHLRQTGSQRIAGNNIYVRRDAQRIAGNNIYVRRDAQRIAGNNIYVRRDAQRIAGNNIYVRRDHNASRGTTFTSDGMRNHHSRVQLPDDVGVGTEEDHSNARLGLLDLHVSHGLLQEGPDGAPVLALAALIVADTAGTVDEECEVNQTTGRCDRRAQNTRVRRSRQWQVSCYWIANQNVVIYVCVLYLKHIYISVPKSNPQLYGIGNFLEEQNLPWMMQRGDNPGQFNLASI